MLKVWLVKFSNGEEWHIFGEPREVSQCMIGYHMVTGLDYTITYLRWIKG